MFYPFMEESYLSNQGSYPYSENQFRSLAILVFGLFFRVRLLGRGTEVQTFLPPLCITGKKMYLRDRKSYFLKKCLLFI